MYSVSGHVYPSVTTVLSTFGDKSGLVSWSVKTVLDAVRASAASAKTASEVVAELDHAAGAPNRVKEAAAAFGTRAHAAIDAIIKSGGATTTTTPPAAAAGKEAVVSSDTGAAGEADEAIQPVVEGFRRWHAASGLRLFPAGDTLVVSHRYRYAGAADAFGWCPARRELCVVDFKTSNSVHPSYALQLAAYANALKEMLGAGSLTLPRDVHAAILADAAGAGAGAGMSRSAARGRGGVAASSLSSQPSHSYGSATTVKRSKGGSAAAAAAPPEDPFSSSFPAGIFDGPRLPQAEAELPPPPPSSSPLTDPDAPLPPLPPDLSISALVVRLDKTTGSAEVKRVRDQGAAFDAFKAALLLWHTEQTPLLE